MAPFHERAQNVFSALNTTPNRFAVEHGFNGASMYNLVTPNRRPGLEMLERICTVEPRISAEYLLRGEGTPLRDKQISADLSTVEQLKVFKAEIIQSLDKRIKELGG